MEKKKPYAPPKLTEHGSAVEQTKGLGGAYWELRSLRVGADDVTE